MTRRIDLKEYETSRAFKLTLAERRSLKEVIPSIGMIPSDGAEDEFHLNPGSMVGAVEIGELSVLIRPKIPIQQLLSMACYAMSAYRSQDERPFGFQEQETLPDALALALAAAARMAFARGLLHGYRTEEETLHTVRGRIMFAEQIRRRFGAGFPVEVRYDEFTDDIEANRLVKAAVYRLGGMRLHSKSARRGLGWLAGVLDNVSLVEYQASNLPDVAFDRLNEHYRGVVGLAQLVLRRNAFEAGRGGVRASGFLMNMNVVFQEFVTRALREAFKVSDRTFCSDRQLTGSRRIYLDKVNCVKLEPDLTWWEGGKCLFAGDAKYKRIQENRAPNADLYQMLAYTTALGLPGGMLIYAEGDPRPVIHEIVHSNKRLEVTALDLSKRFDQLLGEVRDVAVRIKELRDEAR